MRASRQTTLATPHGATCVRSPGEPALQPGEGIPGAHNLPIGQVFFVPREEVTMRDCTDEELAAIRTSKVAFYEGKAAAASQRRTA